MNLHDLIGEWELKRFTIEKPNGETKNWGINTKGILIYTSNGYMSIAINSTGIGYSKKDSSNHILFYSGTYEISDDKKIIHHVTNASDIKRIGKEMLREVDLVNDELKLIAKGDFGIARLVWEKIKKKIELQAHSIDLR